MSVVLPWPPKELSPNARVHYRVKAAAVRTYQDGAYWLAVNDRRLFDPLGEIKLRCEFYPPDRRARDLDNMFASIKAGMDGIARSFGINDQRFAFEIFRRDPVKGGKVVVTVLS